MTGGAFLGSRFVEEDSLAGNRSCQLVAARAAYVAVLTLERERCPLIMVEKRRLPFHAVVAIRAVRDLVLRKLLAMDVLVALFTLGRRRLEIYVGQPSLLIWWFAAIRASGGAMSANQEEGGCRMIKA